MLELCKFCQGMHYESVITLPIVLHSWNFGKKCSQRKILQILRNLNQEQVLEILKLRRNGLGRRRDGNHIENNSQKIQKLGENF